MPPWILGSVVVAFGLIFFLLGVFGRDFRWGMSGDGEPAPLGFAKGLFIVTGLIFAIAGIVAISK
jgi:hypothetical protein